MVAQHQDFEFELGSDGPFELPPPDTYIVAFLGIHAAEETQRTDYNTKEKLYDDEGNPLMKTDFTMQFRIDDPDDDYHKTEFRGKYFPKRVTSGNKTGKLLAALLGVEPGELPVPLPPISSLKGRRFKATLVHGVAKTTGNKYLAIDSFLALSKKDVARLAALDADDDDDPGF